MSIVLVESQSLGEGWLRVSRGSLVVHCKSAHVYEPEWSLMAELAGAGPAAALR